MKKIIFQVLKTTRIQFLNTCYLLNKYGLSTQPSSARLQGGQQYEGAREPVTLLPPHDLSVRPRLSREWELLKRHFHCLCLLRAERALNTWQALRSIAELSCRRMKCPTGGTPVLLSVLPLQALSLYMQGCRADLPGCVLWTEMSPKSAD